MPISLVELEDNEATAPVEIGGQTGYATYRPFLVTPDLEREARELETQIGTQSALAKILSRVLSDWDVERDGDTVPIEYEALCKLPTVLLSAVYAAILRHMRPGEDERKNLGATSSSRKMSSGGRPIGTRG